jgi:CheY-like chemotaxis protein
MTNIDCIYIVEDDSVASFVIKKVIGQKMGNSSCMVLPNGKLALEKLRSGEIDPDLIFLDINMPIMDGWEFLDACIEESRDTIPVFLLSSSINPADKARAMNYSQVLGFLSKPFTSQKLDDVLSLLDKTK